MFFGLLLEENQSGSCCDDRALGMHVTPGGDVFITGTFWSSYITLGH